VLEQRLPPQAAADGCPATGESEPKPRLESEPITDAIVLAFGRRRRRQPDGIALTR